VAAARRAIENGQRKIMAQKGQIHLGTSAFTAAGWEGVFYPEGMKPVDYLEYYSTQFGTVEVDSTYYRIPAAAMVKRWYNVTPPGFIFAAKMPQVLTDEKVLEDCEEELGRFLSVMDLLKEKLGPLLIQFPYFNKKAFAKPEDFFARLFPFLAQLPKDQKFALEIRNKNWLLPVLADELRKRRIALALVDHPWMPRPDEVFQKFDPITADFTYIRWLGDRYGIEKETKTWDKTIVDRRPSLSEWAKVCNMVRRRGVNIFAYANNHFAGHAPSTIRLFEEIVEHAPRA